MSQEIQDIQYKIEPIFKKYGVIRAGIFGSYARNESNKDSDVDFLIKFSNSTDFFDYMILKDELEHTLGTKVDIVSEQNIVPYFKEYIYKDLKQIYGEKQ